MLKERENMAETEELKQMVLSFRRAELIDLLSFVGLNKVGVKATLLQRAVSLIQSQRGCSVPVQIKIRDLYRTIHNPYASETARTRARSQQQLADARRRFPTTGSKNISPPQNLSGAPLTQNSSGAVDYSSSRCAPGVENHNQSSSSGFPVHPDVRFKRLPFYDILGELLKPTSLVPRGTSRYQETYFVFHLTPQQAQDIAMSRDFRPNAKHEYTVQIQLRFCFLEISCEQDDNFPPSICVRVNGKMAQLPNPIPNTKPGVEPKRPGRPVDITPLCRISPTMPNHIEISWASEYGRGFCVCINLVKRLTSDTLLTRLKQFGNRHADHTRALIKEKLQHDPESEIATTSLRVSLMCPLGKMRIMLPSRAGTCTHLQCFDASTFLMMNEKKASWICPVCDKPAPFLKLIIDGLFVEILKKVTDVDEVQFLEDGSWSPMRTSKETHIIASPVVKCPQEPLETCSSSPTKKPKVDDVIDLTETDSEDDERPSSSHAISSGSSSPFLDTSPSPVFVHSPTPPAVVKVRGPSFSSSSTSCLPPLPSLVSFQAPTSRTVAATRLSTASASRSSASSAAARPSNVMPARPTGTYPDTSYTASSSAATGFSPINSSSPAWLQPLGGQGQKRPLSSLTDTLPQPFLKRPKIEKVPPRTSTLSPIVDLDHLCSLLDTASNSDEISSILNLSDFPITESSSSQLDNRLSRNPFNISPSDIISLD